MDLAPLDRNVSMDFVVRLIRFLSRKRTLFPFYPMAARHLISKAFNRNEEILRNKDNHMVCDCYIAGGMCYTSHAQSCGPPVFS